MGMISELKREKIPKLSGKKVFSAIECMNMLLTAEMIIRAALKREESRGSHRRSDFPGQKDTDRQKHIAIRKVDGEMAVSTLPVQKKDREVRISNE
jgi:succinate dehydrogenase/fumarate reductase flavoprotein subunit